MATPVSLCFGGVGALVGAAVTSLYFTKKKAPAKQIAPGDSMPSTDHGMAGSQQQQYRASPMIGSPSPVVFLTLAVPVSMPNVEGMASMESLLRSPFNTPTLPTTDMKLRLPTALTVTDSDGTSFKIAGVLNNAPQGVCRIPIQKLSSGSANEVACLHVSEDDVGSGILFAVQPCAPVAFLDTQHLYFTDSKQVAVFGASDGGWDATAMPSAIVQQMNDNAGFTLLQGSQQVLHFATDDYNRLSHVRGGDGLYKAKFTVNRGEGISLHVAHGADAGLILIATVACLKMISTQTSM